MKKWYESKTVWANVAATLAAIEALPYIPEQYRAYIIGGITLLNIILRIWFTDTGVKKKVL